MWMSQVEIEANTDEQITFILNNSITMFISNLQESETNAF